MTDAELESALRNLAHHIQYPIRPDFAEATRRRLTRQDRALQRRWRFSPMRVALAAAAIVFLAIGATLASIPSARATLAHWFHVPGVIVNSVPSSPPRALGSSLDLGQVTTLSSAQQQVNFTIKQPHLKQLGTPAAVYLRPSPGGSQVSFLYGPRSGFPEAGTTGVGLLVSEFPGSTNGPVMGKLVYSGSKVVEVTVNGQPGYWIEGAHEFFYEGPNGEFEQDTVRLARNTLLWSDNGVTFRIEGNIAQSTAIAVATSIR